MLFTPAIIALCVGSLISGGLLVAASWFGLQIMRHWDLASGSERQLQLERRTYLVSTFVAYAFAFELLSLVLFIHTADALHMFFVGAMCAAGSLNVNAWGYPALILRLAAFLLAGIWLILNYADNQGYDYPLVTLKYVFLLAITPVLLAAAVVQAAYFLGLEPEVITSCCGALFSPQGASVAASLAALPRRPLEIAFFLGMTLLLASGVYAYRTGKRVSLFAAAALLALPLGLAAFISFISIYYYELPTHHCPFCVLQREYHFIGYPLFLMLLAGAQTGVGAGVLTPYRGCASLKDVLPRLQQKLILISLFCYTAFTLMVFYQLLFSNLTM